MKTQQIRSLKYWIKERHNPQSGIYYVPMGRMTLAEAKRHEKPLYGTNYMDSFCNESDYSARLAELRAKGAKIH